GHFTFHGVKDFVLQKNYRVVVTDGGDEKSFGVVRRARHYHLEPRNMHEPGFKTLGVLRRRPDPGSAGGPQHHGYLGLSAEHVLHLGCLVEKLIHRHTDKVYKHQLDHRSQPAGRGSNRGSYYCALRNGRVAHSLRTELIEQSTGY